jgi:hypothetical protein
VSRNAIVVPGKQKKSEPLHNVQCDNDLHFFGAPIGSGTIQNGPHQHRERLLVASS